ncbi:MAG: phage major capsid protein [Chromatiaceae bacterium]|nr:phage major capsid protein [Chromatiaceae bacterium]
MNLQTIRERRGNVVAEMRNLTEAAATEDRDLNDKETAKFDELRGRLTNLDKQLERAEVIAEAERSMQGTPLRPGQDGNFEDACRNFSVTRAIAAQLEPRSVDAGREFEISQEIARRSGRNPSGFFVPHEVFTERRTATTTTQGGELVPTQHRADLMVDRLRASLQVEALGATVLSGLIGDQSIPRLTQSATAYWVAEHGAVTESNHDFDAVSLSPTTVGALVQYSRRMLINAVPSVEQLVRRDLAQVLATEIDNQAINGTGSSNTPTGILAASGTTAISHGTDGGAPTWAKVLEFIASMQNDNALMGSLGWLTSPNVVAKLRNTVKVGSTDSRMIMEEPGNLAGYALRQSTHVPDNLAKGTGTDLSALIFGNWSDLIIGYWSAVDILVNPYHSDVYAKGGVLINALQDCDVAVRHPESFAIAEDVDAS